MSTLRGSYTVQFSVKGRGQIRVPSLTLGINPANPRIIALVSAGQWIKQMTESMDQRLNESVNQRINESISQWITMKHRINKSTNQSVNERMNEWMGGWTDGWNEWGTFLCERLLHWETSALRHLFSQHLVFPEHCIFGLIMLWPNFQLVLLQLLQPNSSPRAAVTMHLATSSCNPA